MQLFGDLDTLSFIRLSRLNWIGYVNRMENKGKLSQVFNNYPQGIGISGYLKRHGGILYEPILINKSLKLGIRGQ